MSLQGNMSEVHRACGKFEDKWGSRGCFEVETIPLLPCEECISGLNNRPTLSITLSDDMLNKFMTRYCPPSKMAEWRKKITHFEQEGDESLRDAWERYSDYFLQCPHHGFEEKFRIETFYGGLHQEDKILIDSLCQGKLMNKTPPKVNELLEDMATK
ncbi:unnamed protein product [Linum trigynum]|uniref:Retrotransposon gag domain-containing protein n=1 Tax=Linum trigynum TaxID=586398 RepID=A0AAV2GR27_9ROSI